MAERFLYLLQRSATLHEPGREGMAERMKGHVLQPRALDSGFPGAAEGIPVPDAEDVALAIRHPAPSEHGVRVSAKRHLAGAVTLGPLQEDHATSAVDALPRKPQYLALAQAGEGRELDEVSERPVLALAACGE